MTVKALIDEGQSVQGNWIGTYGSSGYMIGDIRDTSKSFTLFPDGVSLVYDDTVHGNWNSNATIRTLTRPDGQPQGATYYYDGERPTGAYMTFKCAVGFKGKVWVYAVDWDTYGPRQLKLTLKDQSDNSYFTNEIEAYVNGYWTGWEVDVPADGNLELNVQRLFSVANTNAVISGIFFDEEVYSGPVVSYWTGEEELPATMTVWNEEEFPVSIEIQSVVE